jgi:hypothetical protein
MSSLNCLGDDRNRQQFVNSSLPIGTNPVSTGAVEDERAGLTSAIDLVAARAPITMALPKTALTF